MALVAGDIVTPLASFNFLGEEAPSYGGGGVPLMGVVESVSGSNIKVDWSDGSVVTYADAGANTLLKVTASSVPLTYHSRVQINPIAGLPNANGAGIGLIIGVLAAGGTDAAVVRFENGDVYLGPAVSFTPVDVNPNVTG